MNVCRYKGFSLVVMLRDEHCPPHVHVDAGTWSARFRFSFWHIGVERMSSLIRIDLLWLCWRDCVRRSGIRRARGIWWNKLQTACLDNQLWDWQGNEVVVMKWIGSTTYMIGSARYEPESNKTLLSLMGAPEGVEIEL